MPAIRYTAAVKQDGTNAGHHRPRGFADHRRWRTSKGKRVAFGKGSSAHNLLVAGAREGGAVLE